MTNASDAPAAPILPDVLSLPRKAQPVEGRVNLVGLTRAELAEALRAAGTPDKQVRMRVGQIWQWVYHWGAVSYTHLTLPTTPYV